MKQLLWRLASYLELGCWSMMGYGWGGFFLSPFPPPPENKGPSWASHMKISYSCQDFRQWLLSDSSDGGAEEYSGSQILSPALRGPLEWETRKRTVDTRCLEISACFYLSQSSWGLGAGRKPDAEEQGSWNSKS